VSKAVLDASALLRFVDGETGSERVEELLNRARTGTVELLMSSINWGEVVYSVLKAHGAEQGRKLLPKLRSLPISVVSVDAAGADSAATFKHTYGIPYADSFAGSLAMNEHASLVTADHDFKALPESLLEIDFLPAKSKA
jgi:predicted nucleic acid-binding protein